MKGPRTENLTVSRAVGANVAALRKARGISQRALANTTSQTGKPVGFSTICRMEKAATPGAPPVAIYVDDVVTLTDTGREVRRRAIEVTQLHASNRTANGEPRRTGYALEAS